MAVTDGAAGDRAVFLDKDGTIVVDVPYNVDPARIELAPGAVDGLRELQVAAYRLVIVSNQSGLARGYFDEAALGAAEAHVLRLLEEAGVSIDALYTCGHHPEGTVARYRMACDCRKPKPGLLLRAARELGVDLTRSWMVGDILHDVEAGRRAGCRTVLVDNGGETEWVLTPDRVPDHVAPDLLEAARAIVAADAVLEARG